MLFIPSTSLKPTKVLKCKEAIFNIKEEKKRQWYMLTYCFQNVSNSKHSVLQLNPYITPVEHLSNCTTKYQKPIIILQWVAAANKTSQNLTLWVYYICLLQLSLDMYQLEPVLCMLHYFSTNLTAFKNY